jgi:hypothetical protein
LGLRQKKRPATTRGENRVRTAIAEALQRAARAGAFDTVTALTAELKARRAARARARVVSLEAARARRDGKS